MAYDPELAERVRGVLAAAEDAEQVREKRMFGGLAFLVRDAMAVAAASEGRLMVRAGPERLPDLLDRTGTEPMVMGGREMKGWLLVDAAGVGDDELAEWVTIGIDAADASRS